MDFKQDYKTQDAVLRNMEVLGQAVKMLSAGIRARHNDIPWKLIAGTRDRLIHDYFGVNWDIVWGVVTNDIPILLRGLDRIHESLKKD